MYYYYIGALQREQAQLPLGAVDQGLGCSSGCSSRLARLSTCTADQLVLEPFDTAPDLGVNGRDRCGGAAGDGGGGGGFCSSGGSSSSSLCSLLERHIAPREVPAVLQTLLVRGGTGLGGSGGHGRGRCCGGGGGSGGGGLPPQKQLRSVQIL